MENKITTPVVKGIILSLILIIYGLVIYFVDSMEHPQLAYAQYAIIIGGLIWACISYSRQLNANVTFGNLFAHGFKTTAVITVIMLAYTLIAVKFLFPEMVDKSMQMSREQMEKSGKLSDSQIDQQLSMVKDHFVLITVVGIIIGSAIIGAVSSLIGAAVAKKKPQDPFGNQTI